MRLLLDTHALIWFMNDSPKLPVSVVRQFVDVSTTLYISRISLLEIAIKSQLAKEAFPLIFEHWVQRFQQFDFEMLEITDAHLVALNQLPAVKDHRDPFDRLLIAQVLTESLPLVSRDGKFGEYVGASLQTRWA